MLKLQGFKGLWNFTDNTCVFKQSYCGFCSDCSIKIMRKSTNYIIKLRKFEKKNWYETGKFIKGKI